MAGKGGGAWKVAYADFVTAMMAFFMVMWLVGQKEDLKEAVAEHFQSDPLSDVLTGDNEHSTAQPDGRGGGKRHLDVKLVKRDKKKNAAGDSMGDNATKKPRTLVVHSDERTGVATTVPFAAGSQELTDEGRDRLLDFLPKILGKPHKIEIRGHCFARNGASDSEADADWNLAFARSLVVQRYLLSQGIPAEQVRLSAAGRYEPFTIAADIERRNRNERVEVYLLNEFVADLQGSKAEREKLYEPESESGPPSEP